MYFIALENEAEDDASAGLMLDSTSVAGHRTCPSKVPPVYGDRTVVDKQGQVWEPFWTWADSGGAHTASLSLFDAEFGSCDASSPSNHCFQRLPAFLEADSTWLMAEDSYGRRFSWKFSSSNPVASAAWATLRFGAHVSVQSDVAWTPIDADTAIPVNDAAFRAPRYFSYSEDASGAGMLVLDDDGKTGHSTMLLGTDVLGSSSAFGAAPLVDNVDSAYFATGPLAAHRMTLYYRSECSQACSDCSVVPTNCTACVGKQTLVISRGLGICVGSTEEVLEEEEEEGPVLDPDCVDGGEQVLARRSANCVPHFRFASLMCTCTEKWIMILENVGFGGKPQYSPSLMAPLVDDLDALALKAVCKQFCSPLSPFFRLTPPSCVTYQIAVDT